MVRRFGKSTHLRSGTRAILQAAVGGVVPGTAKEGEEDRCLKLLQGRSLRAEPLLREQPPIKKPERRSRHMFRERLLKPQGWQYNIRALEELDPRG